MAEESLTQRLGRRIAAEGPLAVSAYVEAALYDETHGFYATTGRAGRRGDFLTAPEVGPLFGAVVARALDSWWDDLGRPDPFVVHEWGAGPGTLARAVVAAGPDVLTSGALEWVLIERSAAQRALHPEHPQLTSVERIDPMPGSITGVVLANELLDNLPFDIVERIGTAWAPLLVAEPDREGRFALAIGEPSQRIDLDAMWDEAATIPAGTRVPVPEAALAWLAEARAVLHRGRAVVIDYGAAMVELADRDGGWLRTHRSHDGRADWLIDPGSCDITIDVPFDLLAVAAPPDTDRRQDDWLRAHGIDDLVDEGRRRWDASAGVGDLAALTARSRIREGEALCDPEGMGSFRVVEWTVEPGSATPAPK